MNAIARANQRRISVGQSHAVGGLVDAYGADWGTGLVDDSSDGYVYAWGHSWYSGDVAEPDETGMVFVGDKTFTEDTPGPIGINKPATGPLATEWAQLLADAGLHPPPDASPSDLLAMFLHAGLTPPKSLLDSVTSKVPGGLAGLAALGGFGLAVVGLGLVVVLMILRR